MTMIDPGAHRGVLKEAVTTEAKTGSLRIELRFSVYEGVDRTVFLPLTDKAREAYVDQQLEDIGFNGDFAEPKFNEDLYSDGIDLWCKHEEYEGNSKEVWQISTGGGGGPPAAEDKLKRLNASWKSKHSGPPARPTGRPTPPAERTSAPPPRSGPPARSGPPPRQKEPAAPPMTQDEAWGRWEQAAGDKAVDTERWYGVCDEIGIAKFGEDGWKSKDESAFGPEEWDAVAKKAIPF